MPTHTRPTIRRSCEEQSLPLRRQGNLRRPPPPTAVVVQASRAYAAGRPGESRGGFPLWQGVWGMCPHYPKMPPRAGGWAQPTSQCRPKSPPFGCRACPAPCFPLSVSRHSSPGPSAPIRPAPWQIRLVSLCRLFPRPPAGPSAPPSGQCLAATTCPPLSTCPSRLKPKLHRVPPGTGRPEKTRSTIQSKSNRRSTKASEGSVIELLRGRGRRPAEAEGG